MKAEEKGLLAIGYTSIRETGNTRDLDRRADRICEYCSDNGITLNLVFSDDGGRGDCWKVLEEMVQRYHERTDLVVVAEMDNLSRDVGWLLLKQAEFESKYGVEIVSAKGSQLSLDKDGGMSFG